MKRVYKQVACVSVADGFEVQLDGRQLKSPAKHSLILPTERLAQIIASEWDAVEDKVDPAAMPQFSLAVTVLDRVSPQRDVLIDEMVRYGMNDLLCYREGADSVLATRQSENWDAWLSWGAGQFDFAFETTTGIMPISQDEANRPKLETVISALNDWQLGVLVRAASLGGSLLLGLGFVHGALTATQLFELSFLDEIYQGEKWGEDAEAVQRLDNIRAELEAAHLFLELI